MGTDVKPADFLSSFDNLFTIMGTSKVVRVISRSVINLDNPGAAPTETLTNFTIPVLFTDFDENLIPDVNTSEGSSMAILSIKTLTDLQRASVVSGSLLIDGSKTYTITRTNPIFFNGTIITIIVQLRG